MHICDTNLLSQRCKILKQPLNIVLETLETGIVHPVRIIIVEIKPDVLLHKWFQVLVQKTVTQFTEQVQEWCES